MYCYCRSTIILDLSTIDRSIRYGTPINTSLLPPSSVERPLSASPTPTHSLLLIFLWRRRQAQVVLVLTSLSSSISTSTAGDVKWRPPHPATATRMRTQKGKKKSLPPRSRSNNATTTNSSNAIDTFREKRSRRHGNKWREQNDDSDTIFRTSLINQGYTIKEMNADGNCLFRSLADQLQSCHHAFVVGSNSNTNSMHVVVRQDVCNFLSQHKEEFQHFLLMEDDDEDVFNVDQYIEKMRKVRYLSLFPSV